MSATHHCARGLVLLGLIVSLFSHSASAVHLNESGDGQVLLLPFYTVEAGYQSLLSIRNTQAEAKALRVRFREAYNQREVLQFNLYLGPNDSWSGAVFSLDDEGPANLLTRDRSCSVPDIIGQSNQAPFLPELGEDRYVPFRNFAYVIDDDEGPDSDTRTRTGMIEIIEMGVLDDVVRQSASAATLVQGMPNDCAQLNAAWLTDAFGEPQGYWALDPAVDLLPPRGGLSAELTLINVLDAVAISYPATALAHFSPVQQHQVPGHPLPDLSSVASDIDADGFVDSLTIDPVSGEEILSNWDRPIDAVSALIMSPALDLDFNLFRPGEEWQTSPVISFVTKRYYTDQSLVGSAPLPPFSTLFSQVDNAADGACDDIRVRTTTREAQTTDRSCARLDCINDTDPPTPNITHIVPLCAAVNPLYHFHDAPPLFGDRISINPPLRPFRSSGTLTFRLAGNQDEQQTRRLIDRDGRVYSGLPALAFSVQKLTNRVTFGQGVLGNYAGLFESRRRSVVLETLDE